MSVSPARRAALNVLGRVRRDAAFSGPVLNEELAVAGLTPADSALATRLAYGVLSAQGILDEALARYIKGSLEPQVRDALRLSAFEVLFGDEPAYAVVDQAVEMVRKARPQAAGLANAVMRKLADEAPTFPWGDPATDRDALARKSGHPRWIVDLVLASLGEHAGMEMLACGLEPAPVFVRLDPFASDPSSTLDSLQAAHPVQSPPDPHCYRLDSPSAAFSAGPTRSGWFSMDAAAQMAPLATGSKSGMKILDIGAGRGNKTICLQSIATRSGGPAHITAVDMHAGKIGALKARLEAAGVPAVRTLVADAMNLGPILEAELFDTVLLDAPCTGLGTLRRYPEKRWRLVPEDVDRMSKLQLELLASASATVRPGGKLVYSTCSIAQQENEEVVDAFLSADGSMFRLGELGSVIPVEWQRFATASGCFQSWPTSGGPDGHFVAVLQRIGE